MLSKLNSSFENKGPVVRKLTVRNLHWHNSHATLFERKHKIIAFADDIKWAGENGLAASLKVGWVGNKAEL